MRFLRQGGLAAIARFAHGDNQQQGYAAAILANMIESGTCIILTSHVQIFRTSSTYCITIQCAAG